MKTMTSCGIPKCMLDVIRCASENIPAKMNINMTTAQMSKTKIKMAVVNARCVQTPQNLSLYLSFSGAETC